MKWPSIALLSLLSSAVLLYAQTSSYRPQFQVTSYADHCTSTKFNAVAGLIVGDFNGDHIPDLAVGCGTGEFDDIVVLLGRAGGGFGPPVVNPVTAAPVWAHPPEEPFTTEGVKQGNMVAADVNGDGKADLVYSSQGSTITYPAQDGGTATYSSCALNVALSNGDGTFSAPRRFADGLTYCTWGAVDLHGDGIPDLILSSFASGGGFGVMLGQGAGKFASLVEYPAAKGSDLFIQAIGDLNGDGKPDAITVDSNNNVAVWLNHGDGLFAAPVQIATGSSPIVGDFNGDGKLDLACNCGASSQFVVLFGNGDGTFQSPKPSTAPKGLGIDINGDGRLDFVEAYGNVVAGSSIGSEGSQFYLADSDGTFQAQPPVNLPGPLVTADFNQDGNPDLAGITDLGHVAVMINAPGAPTPNWAAKSPAASPPPRSEHAMAYDSGHGEAVLFGGVNLAVSGTPFSDTWLWSGSNWSAQSPKQSATKRYGQVMAYDSAHGQVVLFGGFDGAVLSDTWLWDGANWTEAAPQTSPPARVYATMAFDSTHGQIVLFGGETSVVNGQPLNDTWVWDGSNWTEESPVNTPPARYSSTMAYDSVRDQIILFGGEGQDLTPPVSPIKLNDTWSWNGSNWALIVPQTIPPARFRHQMVYDSSHQRIVLFGGSNGLPMIDTWIWDGANWTEEFTPSSPAPRDGHAMVFDSARNEAVLFGGSAAPVDPYRSVVAADTWTWNGGTSISAVVSAASFGGFSSVAPGSWVEIYGSNLAPLMRPWGAADYAPASLDAVSVSIGGQAAFIDYISSNQVNAQLPSTIPAGAMLPVTITNRGAISAPFNINVNATEPGLLAPASFKIAGQQYVVAQLSDGSYGLPAGAISGVSSRPAKPGETVVMYGIGFGPAIQDIPAGQIVTESNQLAAPVRILFGSTPAKLTYAGLAPNLVGLYQFNAVVPSVPDSNLVPLTLKLGSAASIQTLFTDVQQ